MSFSFLHLTASSSPTFCRVFYNVVVGRHIGGATYGRQDCTYECEGVA